MIFDRNHRARARLQRELRRAAPEPRGAFHEEMVGRLTEARRPERTHRRLRLSAGFALTVLLLALMAAFGGIGYAQTAVADTTSAAVDTLKRAVVGEPAQTTQTTPSPSANFSAAAFVYPAPTLTCTITFSGPVQNRKITVSGTTTLNSGSISVTVTENPDGPNFPYTYPDIAVTAFTWSVGPGNSPKVTAGRTYTATVTQTASGYANGTTTCSAVAPA